MQGEVDGVDGSGVTRWLAERTEVAPPLRFEVIHGGRSNLTFEVVDQEDRRFVLRRPPLHGVLDSAHDVGREHRIMTALAASAVPVPNCIGYEPDPAMIGAPFYVMDHVAGEVVRDAATAAAVLAEPVRDAATDALVSALARLHEVDVDEVGLGDLSRRDHYLERQLRRWHGQLRQTRTRPLPLMDEVHARLAAGLPDQRSTTIVHGDYRLDNLILDPRSGAVRAVLDWELATIGDPLADVGLLLVYWAGPGDGAGVLPDAPTAIPGFPDRAEVGQRYAQLAGRGLEDLDYYVAFARWKLACILEGVHGRYVAGAYGRDADPAFEGMGRLVEVLAEQAEHAATEAGR